MINAKMDLQSPEKLSFNITIDRAEIKSENQWQFLSSDRII